MSGCSLFRAATLTKCIATNASTSLCRTSVFSRIQICGYAKKVAAKGKGKGVLKTEVKGPDVCRDPVRLTSYAVGLKPHDQYPEWLFQMNLGKPQKLQELDSETWEYWKRLRKEKIWHSNRLHKGKKF
uniref:Large ribosomal subunit protein mL54 n=1 Tax=Gasterosteus aculeatus aculeatus TaxID=481459 RepID=A0AAQ4RZI3_GASAC